MNDGNFDLHILIKCEQKTSWQTEDNKNTIPNEKK